MLKNLPIFDSKTFTADADTLQHFIFEQANVRGELVHLNNSYQTLITQHNYPAIVQRLLGEALTATTLIASSLKYAGAISLQIQGNGPISLLVAECDDQLRIRAVAHWQDNLLNSTRLADLFGQARLMITLSATKYNERYQGIVELYGESISDCVESYFNQSEQLPCRMWIAVNQQTAAGLLLQTLPSTTGNQASWQHLLQLTNTITTQELINLPNETLLHRLYHQEELQTFTPKSISFFCKCTLARMENALRTMSYEEAIALAETEKVIVVTCDFCNSSYEFDKVDVGRIFKGSGFVHNREVQ